MVSNTFKTKLSDLTAEFAELENQGAEVMDEDALRQMTVQGDPIQAAQSEKVDPSQMYSGISMADDRINQLKVGLLIYFTSLLVLIFRVIE